MLAFNELMAEHSDEPGEAERVAPFVLLAGVAVVGVGVGIAAGYVFNRPK